jgi:hypothetical protein
MLAEAFAVVTGRSQASAPRKAGRTKGAVGDWQFRCLVGTLWQIVNECGGELTFSCKENRGSGTMVEALGILRPLLPAGFIPNCPSAKTIERVKATLTTEVYPGFNSANSAYT